MRSPRLKIIREPEPGEDLNGPNHSGRRASQRCIARMAIYNLLTTSKGPAGVRFVSGVNAPAPSGCAPINNTKAERILEALRSGKTL